MLLVPRKKCTSMMHNINANAGQNKKMRFRDGDAVADGDDDTVAATARYNNMTFKTVRPTHSSRVEKFLLLKKIRNCAVTFFQSTTIHGVVYLARHGLHFIERYFTLNIIKATTPKLDGAHQFVVYSIDFFFYHF